MKALTFHGPRRVRYEEVEDPAIEEPGDAIVRVEVAGLCGSDLHPYRGHERGLDIGTVMGHEFVGEVVSIGGSVQSLATGDRVVAPFSTSCGDCFYCLRGLTSRCERGRLFGWIQDGEGLHGGQAELVRVPLAESSLVRLPAGLEPAVALLAADVIPTGLFAAELGEVGSETTVAVLGCGPVGLLAVASSRLRGAPRILAVDSVRERLGLAGELGAEVIDREETDVSEAVRELTGGRGADAVLEVVGSAEAARLAIDCVRPGGVVAAVGFHTDARFAFTPGEAYDRNLTYRTGRCPARRFMDEALAMVRRRELALERIITHRLPLAEGSRAYEMFDEKLESCIKVVMQP